MPGVAEISDVEAADLRAFGQWLDGAGAELTAHVDALLDAGDDRRSVGDRAALAAVFEKAAARRHAALVDGIWQPYIDALVDAGHTLAEIGIPLREWFASFGVYRRALLAHQFSGPDQARRALAGFGRFVDLSMGVLGDAFQDRQRRLYEATRAQAELYAELVARSPNPKAIIEWVRPPNPATFQYRAGNPAMAKVNSRIDELLVRPIAQVHPDFVGHEMCERLIRAAVEGDSGSFILEPSTGGVYDVRAFRIRERFIGMLYYDITERVRMQADLARRLDEVEEANKSLDAFAYVASHDLKAPLRDITNLSTWIADDARDALPAGSRRHLDLLRDRVTRMERLLDDLLAYSRAGRIRSKPEDVTAAALIEEAVALAGPRDGFEIRVAGADRSLTTPRTPLVQVLRNLVDNALKHHDRPRGVVSIDVADAPGGMCRFVVADDGPGIPAAFHERVFQPFQTLRPRDQVEGSGMGLAIVKKLIESHGGRIAIEAHDGPGARLAFTWPRRSPRREGVE